MKEARPSAFDNNIPEWFMDLRFQCNAIPSRCSFGFATQISRLLWFNAPDSNNNYYKSIWKDLIYEIYFREIPELNVLAIPLVSFYELWVY